MDKLSGFLEYYGASTLGVLFARILLGEPSVDPLILGSFLVEFLLAMAVIVAGIVIFTPDGRDE